MVGVDVFPIEIVPFSGAFALSFRVSTLGNLTLTIGTIAIQKLLGASDARCL